MPTGSPCKLLRSAPYFPGQRFVMIKEGEQESASVPIILVLNWFEELKRLVPTN